MKKNHSQTPQTPLEKTNFLKVFIIGTLSLVIFFSLSSFLQIESEPVSDSIAETENSDTVMAVDETTGEVSDTVDIEDSDEYYILDEEFAEAEEIDFVAGEYTTRQKRIGERLFNGLAPFESGLHNCSSCHYIDAQEEMNWNPAAYELAKIWKETPDYSIANIMNNPVSMRLMEDHKGMNITATEQHLLEAYYTEKLKRGPDELQAYPINAAIFWGLGILMLLAVVDLLFTRKIPFKGVHVLILFVGIAVHGQYVMAETQRMGRTEDYAPDQPIKFSHLIHAGENEIDCEYCHFTATYSLSANIPSNDLCLNCHNVVRNGTNSGTFEINKIHKAAETGQPIEWIRIHKLPDHSFFSHAQHYKVGQLDCTECHGEVETMHIVQQVEDLSMGWCLTCHRDNDVDFTDNPYFEIYHTLHQKMKNGEIDGVRAADLGGEDCMSCHY